MKLPTLHLAARQDSLREVDRTTAITAASWTLMFMTVIAFTARQVVKTIASRRLAIDDAFVLLATAFAVGVSATTIVLASHGLGASGNLTTERTDMFMKSHYASEMVYISAICFAKLSILVVFYAGFERFRLHRRFVSLLGCFILAWSFASVLAVAVQCALPRPWDTVTLRCFDTRTFWIIYCIIDAITEMSLISASVVLVAYLQVPVIRKVAIVACFAPRALVICAAVLRLMWLYPASPHKDAQFRLWIPYIVTQVHVCLSICTACIPYIVSFFRAIEGDVGRSNSTRTQKDQMNKSYGRIGSSLWFRRHKSRGAHDSWDFTDASNDDYRRVSSVSPYLATPRPRSPMMPPQVRSPPIRSSSKNGLCISIPLAQRIPEYDMLSSRTASSFALSPTCASPQPLLTPFITTRRAPSPPPKTYTPDPTSAGFQSTSNSITQQDTPRSGHFSLFPLPRVSSRSPQPRHTPVNSPPIAPVPSMRTRKPSNSLSSPPITTPKATPQPDIVQPVKFSTTPKPRSPPPTLLSTQTKPQIRPGSVDDLNSPMGAALNSFFGSSAAASPGGYARNQQYLAPFTPIKETVPGLNSRTSRDAQRDETFLPANMTREDAMPVVRDTRSKANVVVVGPL
ncbi:hypothetical protein T440DRAFT_470050 [Plenodomus tracheiphilus IPT5]|uniref:Rhodopsin domain-containing protein n=1 Tax=Plenodomus tracheiphilus IPT5 TaxID=1408161 RepID=A0A6A7AZI5_9PLEO|nr:hypothetical protein T440DRAFT_470050 [Plenodomus tracheiphilus IPT5]